MAQEYALEVLPVQDIEPDERALARAHPFHRRLVLGAPLVGKAQGIDVDPVPPQERLGTACDARAPVDHGAEDIETEKADRVERIYARAPWLPAER